MECEHNKYRASKISYVYLVTDECLRCNKIIFAGHNFFTDTKINA